jgi:uncharacterized phage protein gp47/JayE
LKTVDKIYEELLETFSGRAGYSPDDSCDLAVRLYAAAAQLQALSIQADWVLDQSFPQTAQGRYLDSHAAMRGITRSAAAKAAGTLRFFVQTAPAVDLTVASGTVCMTADEVRFQTTESVILAAGSLYADAHAEALTAGTSGNAVAGAVTVLTACPVGITACTNPAAFTGGCDAEDDEALRARILESYRRLPNGANAAYYEKTAMSHSGVAAARAVGRARGIGTVDVYIATSAGIPSDRLLTEIREDLSAKREIAVDVKVLAPKIQSVDLSVEISVKDGCEEEAAFSAVKAAVGGYFTGTLLGKPIRLAELGNLIFSVDGVENYHILKPAADLDADDAVLPAMGMLTVTKIGEE